MFNVVVIEFYQDENAASSFDQDKFTRVEVWVDEVLSVVKSGTSRDMARSNVAGFLEGLEWFVGKDGMTVTIKGTEDKA